MAIPEWNNTQDPPDLAKFAENKKGPARNRGIGFDGGAIVSGLRTAISRVRGVFAGRRADEEFAEEIEAHFALLMEENMRRGMPAEEARRAARLKMGSEAALREAQHDGRTLPWLESLWQDVRFALRVLRKNPGFTIMAVLTLALGIGAATAVFTIVDGVVLKSLGYPNANRIVAVDTRWTDSGHEIPRVGGADVNDLRGAGDSFEAFSYYYGGQMGVQLAHAADFGGIYFVDPDFFRVLAVHPAAGRTFSAADASRSAVVSRAFAARNFGSEASALGQTISIEGTAYEIVGVLPAFVQFPAQAQVWAAVSPTPYNLNRTAYNYHVVAMLRPGFSKEQADARLLAIGNRLAAAFPNSNAHKTFTVQPLQGQLAAPVRTTLLLLLGAVALVLLIACANVANLMLARGAGRMYELATRSALGAGRARLARQLLAESGMVGACAGALGILLAAWETQILLAIGARMLPKPLLANIHMDWRVLVFAIGVSLGTSVLFGIAPAWQAASVDVQSTLKRGGVRGMEHGPAARVRSALVAMQIALSLALAVGGGLLFRTLLALHSSQMGFRTEGILVTYASAPGQTLPQVLDAVRRLDDVHARLRALPGVISAGGAMGLPAAQYSSDGSFAIEGKQSFNGNARNLPHAGFRLASPGYFATMGVPLVQGRDFDEGDVYDKPFVAIISKTLAREEFPGENPIGHRIQCGLDNPGKWMTVVGVVGDVRQSSPSAQPEPELYMPLRQHPFMANDEEVVARTSVNPEDLIPAVQSTIRGVDPEIAMRFTTMNALVSDSIGAERFRAVLAGIFSGIALLLALSGMYAVMSYVTTQRTAEFGLRAALGAQPGNILRLVLRSAMRLAVTGLAAGLLLSAACARFLASMLFGVKPMDATTYGLVIAIVIPVILIAAAVPAWRASRVDPMKALRAE